MGIRSTHNQAGHYHASLGGRGLSLPTPPPPPEVGEDLYYTSGSYSWIAPPTSEKWGVNVVCIGGGGQGGGGTVYYTGNGGGGGGGLGWRNGITVTAGQSYTVVVGAKGDGGSAGGPGNAGGNSYFINPTTVWAEGGGGGQGGPSPAGSGGSGGSYVGEGGGNGGPGGTGQNGGNPGSYNYAGGGGGAGGYSGNGGSGAHGYSSSSGGDGVGGAGGGGSRGNQRADGIDWMWSGKEGGGTIITGQDIGGGGGSDNVVTSTGYRAGAFCGSCNNPTAPTQWGNATQCPTNDVTPYLYNPTGTSSTYWRNAYGYGAGGRGRNYIPDNNPQAGSTGGNGAVRIMWGPKRGFPSLNTSQAYSFPTSA